MYTRRGIGAEEESTNPLSAGVDAVADSFKALWSTWSGEPEKTEIKPRQPGEADVKIPGPPPAKKSTLSQLLVPGLIVAGIYLVTRKKKR